MSTPDPPTNGRAEDALRASLDESRAELDATLGALGGALRATADWRTWVRARPALAIGAAFALGLGLGVATAD